MVGVAGLPHAGLVWDDERAGDAPRVELSDEALCQRVAQGDGPAFDLLVERYQQRAYRLAWSIIRDAEEARDLSQEAFIRLHESAGTFRGRSRFSTWFYRILVNLCLDARRRRRWWQLAEYPVERDDGTLESAIEREPAPAVDPVDGLERERMKTELWQAVGRLSPQQRAVVTLQVQEELSTAETAAVLKCSEATVRVHLHRALIALRKTMRND